MGVILNRRCALAERTVNDMKAIVCDKCGKVNLLEDDKLYYYPSGVYRLLDDRDSSVIDLCEDCAAELVEAVRKTKDGDTDG